MRSEELRMVSPVFHGTLTNSHTIHAIEISFIRDDRSAIFEVLGSQNNVVGILI